MPVGEHAEVLRPGRGPEEQDKGTAMKCTDSKVVMLLGKDSKRG